MDKFKAFRKEFWKMVKEAKSIAITSHIGPDDDSISSMLAVYWLVKNNDPKKRVKMLCKGEQTDEWGYFEGFSEIKFVDEVADHLKREDLLIVLDGSSYERFSKKPGELKKLVDKTICIDHHKNKPDEFDLLFVSANFSSTAEGVHRLLVDGDQKITRRLAEIFLLGILGDTGNFSYIDKNTVGVLSIVEKLVKENDIDIQELQGKYQRFPKNILELTAHIVSNTRYFSNLDNWPPFQVGILERKFADENGFSDDEVARVGHLYMRLFLSKTKDFDWGFLITPREGEVSKL